MRLTINASTHCLQLVESQFGVGHGSVCGLSWLRRRFPPMHTPSPESLLPLMTCVKGACDVGHRGSEALQQLDLEAHPQVPTHNPVPLDPGNERVKPVQH